MAEEPWLSQVGAKVLKQMGHVLIALSWSFCLPFLGRKVSHLYREE